MYLTHTCFPVCACHCGVRAQLEKHITRILARACGAHIVTCQYACSRARAWIYLMHTCIPVCACHGGALVSARAQLAIVDAHAFHARKRTQLWYRVVRNKSPFYNPVPPCSKLGVCELSSIDELLWTLPWITISRPTLNCWGCGGDEIKSGAFISLDLFLQCCAFLCVSVPCMCGCGGQLGFGRAKIGCRHLFIGTHLHESKGAFISHYPVSGFEQVVNWQGFVSKFVAPFSTIVSFCACDGSAFDTHGA